MEAKLEAVKTAVIREPLVKLTGNYLLALVLNQFIYWTWRVRDADELLKEEIARREKAGEESPELCHGWIYKSARELSEELMIGKSAQSMGRYIKKLMDKGWLARRNNPKSKYRWDRRYQYRLDLGKLEKDLREIGYSIDHCLDGNVRINLKTQILAFSKMEDGDSKMEDRTSQNGKTISETTVKIKTEEETPAKPPSPSFYQNEENKRLVEALKKERLQKYGAVADLRKTTAKNRETVERLRENLGDEAVVEAYRQFLQDPGGENWYADKKHPAGSFWKDVDKWLPQIEEVSIEKPRRICPACGVAENGGICPACGSCVEDFGDPERLLLARVESLAVSPPGQPMAALSIEDSEEYARQHSIWQKKYERKCRPIRKKCQSENWYIEMTKQEATG